VTPKTGHVASDGRKGPFMARKYNTPYIIRAIFAGVVGVIAIAIGEATQFGTKVWRDTANSIPAEVWAWGTSILSWGALSMGILLVLATFFNTLYVFWKYHRHIDERTRVRKHHAVVQPTNPYAEVTRNLQAVVDSPRWS